MKGRYDEQELNQVAYIGNERRYDLIYKILLKISLFPCNRILLLRQHAEDMAKAEDDLLCGYVQ